MRQINIYFLPSLIWLRRLLSADSFFPPNSSLQMSATANNSTASNTISTVDDVNLFQAARKNGRRNALGDVGEQALQGN